MVIVDLVATVVREGRMAAEERMPTEDKEAWDEGRHTLQVQVAAVVKRPAEQGGQARDDR